MSKSIILLIIRFKVEIQDSTFISTCSGFTKLEVEDSMET